MFYLFCIAIAILILILMTLVFFIVINKKCTSGLVKIISTTTIVALAIVAYFIEPKISNDLYRHFESIDIIKKYGIETMTTYDQVIGAKFLFYIVSLLPSDHFLPVISILTTYGILFYIIIDFSKNKEISSRVIAIAILLNFAMCTYSTVISGIRNAMSLAFCALALYWDIIKKENIIKRIILYLIAISLHPSAMMVIGCRILINLKNINIFKYLLLFWSLITEQIINILYLFDNDIILYIADKLQIYFTGNWIDDMRLLYVSIIFIIVIYLITKNIKNVQNSKYIIFLQTYMLLILGSVFVAKIFVKRLLILLSFLMMPLVFLIENNIEKNKKLLCYCILLFFICGLIPYSIIEVKANMGLIFNI